MFIYQSSPTHTAIHFSLLSSPVTVLTGSSQCWWEWSGAGRGSGSRKSYSLFTAEASCQDPGF